MQYASAETIQTASDGYKKENLSCKCKPLSVLVPEGVILLCPPGSNLLAYPSVPTRSFSIAQSTLLLEKECVDLPKRNQTKLLSTL